MFKYHTNSPLNIYCKLLLIAFTLISQVSILKAQWVSSNSGINDTIVYVMEYNHSKTKIFAGTISAGLYTSINNGNTWVGPSSGISNDTIFSFAKNDSLLFVGTFGGLFRSNDDGNTWQSVNQNFSNYKILSILIHGNDIFFGTDGNGVFYSPDLGNTWGSVNNGLTQNALNITAITYFGGSVFIGTIYGGVFKSTNNGNSWVAINNGLGCTTYIRSFQSFGNKLFVGTQGCGVYSTIDSGNTWQSSSAGLISQTIIKIIETNGELYVATFGGGVCFSVDSGLTWSPNNLGLNSPYELAVNTIASDGNNFFIGTYGSGAFRLQQTTTQLYSISKSVDGINLFPNPSSDKIFIQSLTPIELIELRDLCGKLIFQTHNALEINISELNNGMYNVIFYDSEKKIFTKRKIIKN